MRATWPAGVHRGVGMGALPRVKPGPEDAHQEHLWEPDRPVSGPLPKRGASAAASPDSGIVPGRCLPKPPAPRPHTPQLGARVSACRSVTICVTPTTFLLLFQKQVTWSGYPRAEPRPSKCFVSSSKPDTFSSLLS